MALTFPLAPVNGDVHIMFGMKYRYNAAQDKWTSASTQIIVDGSNIVNNSIGSNHIIDGSIATADLADGAVTSAKIADGTIATVDLANGAVTSAKIADGTIATIDIADDAITGAKIADNAVTLGTHTTGNYVESVTAGNQITVTNTAGAEGAVLTVAHADTSTLNGQQTVANQFIQSITVDDNGHVTATTSAAPAQTAAQVGSAIADIAAGAVGSALWGTFASTAAVTYGTSVAGSSLKAGSLTAGGASVDPDVQSGTWRFLGYQASGTQRYTLFVRIS